MSGVELVKVRDVDDGMRLNRWFLKYYPGLSLGRFNKLLRTKQIKVDGKKAEAGLKLAAGQEVRVPPLDNEAAGTAEKQGVLARDAEFIRSLVIYKDAEIIVLNKPSGIAVQGGTNTTRHIDGMLNALRYDYEEAPKLVHRIDKETSGILVLARSRKSAELLTKAFRERDLHKTYLALVNGCPQPERGQVKARLDKSGDKTVVSADGKPALTDYRVLDNLADKFALVEARPQTGRTHQIRVHMEYLGCPIVGDDKYFGRLKEKIDGVANKLFLHAYKIDLSGIYNKKLEICAPLPEHFKTALSILGLALES
ncbi:MAG: RluA family pseudouridine synthase [Proteobacteria bacterium]|nr:RluA family pseudouridine synthase [Pseudomonadota bacterium]